MKIKILSISDLIKNLICCTEEECVYIANQHMLIFCAKNSGAGCKDGWMDGWKGGKAGLRIASSNKKSMI